MMWVIELLRENVESMHVRAQHISMRRLTSIISVIWLSCTSDPQAVGWDSGENEEACKEKKEKIEEKKLKLSIHPCNPMWCVYAKICWVKVTYNLSILSSYEIVDFISEWESGAGMLECVQRETTMNNIFQVMRTWRYETSLKEYLIKHGGKCAMERVRSEKDRKCSFPPSTCTFTITSSHHRSSSSLPYHYPLQTLFSPLFRMLCVSEGVQMDIVHVHLTQQHRAPPFQHVKSTHHILNRF